MCCCCCCCCCCPHSPRKIRIAQIYRLARQICLCWSVKSVISQCSFIRKGCEFLRPLFKRFGDLGCIFLKPTITTPLGVPSDAGQTSSCRGCQKQGNPLSKLLTSPLCVIVEHLFPLEKGFGLLKVDLPIEKIQSSQTRTCRVNEQQ